MKKFLVTLLVVCMTLGMVGTSLGFSLVNEPTQFTSFSLTTEPEQFTNFSLMSVDEGYYTTHNHPLEEELYLDNVAFDNCIKENINTFWSHPLTSSDIFIETAKSCKTEAKVISDRLESYGWGEADIGAYHYDIVFYWTNLIDAHR